MVRTYPVAAPALQPARVLAWSTALALHLLALMLLLIPAAYQAVPLPRDKVQVRLIPALPDPAPPAPPPVVPPSPVPAPIVPRAVPAMPLTPALPTATAEIAESAARVEPAAAPATTMEGRGVESPPAATGAHLQYRSAPPPAYPIAALRNGEQGTVLLRVEVNAEGRPTAASVERSSGSRTLDQAARQQVLRRWAFVPAQDGGQAVPAIGLVPVSFSLPD